MADEFWKGKRFRLHCSSRPQRKHGIKGLVDFSLASKGELDNLGSVLVRDVKSALLAPVLVVGNSLGVDEARDFENSRKGAVRYASRFLVQKDLREVNASA